jgi:RNA polymerase sigma-70 factor (ECF subfamily)
MALSAAWAFPQTWEPVPGATVLTREERPQAAVAAIPAASDGGELDDAALVAAALEERPGAFDEIVERHRRAVYQLCYRFVGNHEDAADLSQEVFLRAYRGLRGFRGNAALGTWLHRIAVNASLTRVSLKRPHVESIDDRQFVDTRNESAPAQLIRRERAARVHAAINRLPRKQRAAVILRAYHEMSHQEIADVLGSSVGAVKANFFHGLRHLKKLLGDEEVR